MNLEFLFVMVGPCREPWCLGSLDKVCGRCRMEDLRFGVNGDDACGWHVPLGGTDLTTLPTPLDNTRGENPRGGGKVRHVPFACVIDVCGRSLVAVTHSGWLRAPFGSTSIPATSGLLCTYLLHATTSSLCSLLVGRVGPPSYGSRGKRVLFGGRLVVIMRRKPMRYSK